ncbi:hypothetical protein, partial [Paenibacillus planticolens]|uniref:hypothetical protein n=1 Tax=Paenibacillus planticolens TaxID=2654976 RepID=UPI001C108AB0
VAYATDFADVLHPFVQFSKSFIALPFKALMHRSCGDKNIYYQVLKRIASVFLNTFSYSSRSPVFTAFRRQYSLVYPHRLILLEAM